MLYYQSLYASLDLSEANAYNSLCARAYVNVRYVCICMFTYCFFYVYMNIWGRIAMARSIFSEILTA